MVNQTTFRRGKPSILHHRKRQSLDNSSNLVAFDRHALLRILGTPLETEILKTSCIRRIPCMNG
jgi:hypothetical protein